MSVLVEIRKELESERDMRVAEKIREDPGLSRFIAIALVTKEMIQKARYELLEDLSHDSRA